MCVSQGSAGISHYAGGRARGELPLSPRSAGKVRTEGNRQGTQGVRKGSSPLSRLRPVSASLLPRPPPSDTMEPQKPCLQVTTARLGLSSPQPL